MKHDIRLWTVSATQCIIILPILQKMGFCFIRWSEAQIIDVCRMRGNLLTFRKHRCTLLGGGLNRGQYRCVTVFPNVSNSTIFATATERHFTVSAGYAIEFSEYYVRLWINVDLSLQLICSYHVPFSVVLRWILHA